MPPVRLADPGKETPLQFLGIIASQWEETP